MFTYYFDLAMRSFKRNRVLTALMVLALGLGIGASITTLTVLKLLSGDPLPQKSARIFAPQMDALPKGSTTRPDQAWWDWGNLMTWTDAMNLLSAPRAERQAVMALSPLKITLQVGEPDALPGDAGRRAAPSLRIGADSRTITDPSGEQWQCSGYRS